MVKKIKELFVEIEQHRKIFKAPYSIVWDKYENLNDLEKSLKEKYNAEKVSFCETYGCGIVI